MKTVCALLRPFTGSVPDASAGPRIAGPPASTLSHDQIAAARRDPLSFRYSLGRGAEASQAEGMEWLDRQRRSGALRDVGPAVFIYRQSGPAISAIGLIADVSLEAYAAGRVERHENTIARTERKMADYMRHTRVYGNPVALGHRPNRSIRSLIDSHIDRDADISFPTMDGSLHELWVIAGEEAQNVCLTFDTVLYVTDGHHRLAAAARVAAEEGRRDAFLPAGLFSSEELRLRSFARCVVHVDTDDGAIINRLGAEHTLIEVDAAAARPRETGEFGARVGDTYFLLRLGAAEIPDDAYDALDVNLLQNLILEPVFGIGTRAGRHLQFVADLTETSHLDLDEDVWFLPYPARVEDVMSVADSGRVMPPKSTLFTPKLPAGLVIRPLDET